MFDTLTSKLNDVFRGLRGRGKISEGNVGEVMREIRTYCSKPTQTPPAALNKIDNGGFDEEIAKSRVKSTCPVWGPVS